MHKPPKHPYQPSRSRAVSRVTRLCVVAVAVGVLAATAATSAFGSGARTITTIAGSPSGLFGFGGDGGPAADALLKKPTGLAVDPQGDIFVVDSGNSRVRKIDPSGTITTIAGSGVSGYLGDGDQATLARVSPTGVAVDEKGDLYISDCENDVVRKVDPGGEITTVAGTGIMGFLGDNGPATAARLNCPIGLAVDGAENLYIADRGNKRVRKVTPAGAITTFAGNGNIGPPTGDGGPATSATFFPQELAFDSDGNLYIADAFDNNVRKIDSSGTITTFAGTGQGFNAGDGGPATSASLMYPAGVAVDEDGNVFITTQCRIREVDTGGTIRTIAGTEYCGLSGDGCAATSAQFYGANSGVSIPLAVDGEGNLFLADYSANNVREILTTEPPASCTAPPITAPTTPKPSPRPAPKPPVVKITSAPPAETAEQKASFGFKGVAGGSYECSIDAGAWSPCQSGQSFGPLLPGDHRFQVREKLNGITGPAASYHWTIDLPRACIIKVARARVSALTQRSRARLVIHYKAYEPAQVTVSYALAGSRGKLRLGTASRHFKTAGIFRQGEKLGKGALAKLRATMSMTVRFSIPQAPSSCTRYYTKRLTIPHHPSPSLTVWFQSDSIFAS